MFAEFRFNLFAAENEIGILASIKPNDICNETDLLWCPFAVRAVHLPVDVPGIHEQNFVGAVGFLGRGGTHPYLGFIEEPKRAGERHRVKHVRADGDHHVHAPRFNELVAKVLLGTAGVGGGVRDGKSGAAFFIQRGIEKLNPEIIGVVGARQAKGEAASRPDGIFQPIFVHGVHVERRVREDEVGSKDTNGREL